MVGVPAARLIRPANWRRVRAGVHVDARGARKAALNARGESSLAELETHIEIARRLNYLKSEDADQLLATCASIGRMMGSLQNSLQKKLAQG